MTLEIFLMLLLIVSTLTGLATEAIKTMLDECGKTYHANILAGVVALVLSIGVGSGYLVLADIAINQQDIVILIALVFMSWLSAMVGYDKVVQAIAQMKKG